MSTEYPVFLPAEVGLIRKTFFSEMLADGGLSVNEATAFAEELLIAGVESVSKVLSLMIDSSPYNRLKPCLGELCSRCRIPES